MKSEEVIKAKRATKKKQKPIRFTKEVKSFICEKMSEGLTVAEIHRKYPAKCPKAQSVYKKSMEDDEWADQLDRAYTLWYFNKQEELDRLSTGLASELYPGVDFREAEAALKRRIDTLKFSLGKMAPIMSKRFDRTAKVEITGDVGSTYNVINYHKEVSRAELPNSVPSLVPQCIETIEYIEEKE